ncbi:MAG: sulfatase, partial [Planctomycetes bacterium]|nr:sulfatase [Planctomycetota bacterium]
MTNTYLRMIGVCACFGVFLSAGCDRREEASEAEADKPRPHVILISIDTLRADHLGCYGYARDTSPNIDRLARKSIRFENAYAQASWTLPSHMSIMTSQYPHVHGVEQQGQALPESATTLAETLSDAGYLTAALISWVFVGEKYGFAQGFDQFTELVPPPELVDSATSAAFKAEQVTDHAIEWLSRDRDQPFFLFLHYFDPHINYDAPEPYTTMFDPDYDGPAKGDFDWITPYIKGLHHNPRRVGMRDLKHLKALYDGEIRYTDAHLGRFFDALDRSVGLDNCLIVLTSD